MATEIAAPGNPAMIAEAHSRADALANAIQQPVIAPNTFVFVANFDGTRNDKGQPAHAGTEHITAVGSLSNQIKKTDNVAVEYEAGVGSPDTPWISQALPDAESKAMADSMYDKFVDAVANWRKIDGNEHGEVTVLLNTFSRGSVAGAYFSHKLFKDGVIDPEAPTKPDGSANYLIPPGKVGISGGLIISPVNSGSFGNNLAFAPNVQNLAVIIADHEFRTNYPQAIYNQPGVSTYHLIGNHGDVGTFYDNGLGALHLNAYTGFYRNLGLEVISNPERQFNPSEVVIHNETWGIDTFWNYHYASVVDGIEARTVLTGNPAVFTEDEIVFTDYEGNVIRQPKESFSWVDQYAQYKAESDDKNAQIEAQRRAEIEYSTAAREAGIEAYGSLIQLGQAVASGDGVEMARALAHYTLAQDRNAWHQGQGSSLGGAGLYGLSAVANALDLTQALRGGDGWGIAGETAALLRDIDGYVQANGSSSFLGQDGRAVLGGVQSALNLAAAIDGGNGWAIAGSTLNLLQGINHYFEHAPSVQQGLAATSSFDHAAGLNAGTTATALGGAASAVSLGMNIAHLDDVFATGDAGQIAYSLASTANSAINTYNAGAQLAGGAGIPGAANYAAYLGYAAAALQAMEGDVQGAAVSAASAYLMTCGPYGWAAAAALTIGNMLLGGKSAPPRAHGSFGLDEHGNVVLLEVHGSSKMRGHARAFGEEMLPVLQQFQAGGGRLLIDGTLPSFTLTAGEALRLKYGNEGIGRVEVIVADSSRASLELLGILYARDRGERIEEAIKTSRDGFGNIDLARVDAILAGQGFVKQGLTYTFGETQSRAGTSRGSGERHGGGNVGPEGQVIAAKSEQIVSLPLKPNQLPSQQVGEILGAASLASNFTGWGNELFLMSLIAGGGVFGVAGPVFGRVKQEETNKEYIKPLDGYELSVYERLLASGAIPAAAEGKGQTTDGADRHVPELGPGQMQQFLDAYWDKLLSAGNPFADLLASSAYYHRGLIGYGSLLADGSKASALPPKEHWWDIWPGLTNLASAYGGKISESLSLNNKKVNHRLCRWTPKV